MISFFVINLFFPPVRFESAITSNGFEIRCTVQWTFSHFFLKILSGRIGDGFARSAPL